MPLSDLVTEDDFIPEKICNGCKKSKPVTEFYMRGNSGRSYRCKSCSSVASSKYWKENKEKVAQQKRKYYENNKESVREHTRQHYKNNKNTIRNRMQQHYEENKENILDRNRKRAGTQAVRARQIIRRKVFNGHIIKPNYCQECGMTVEKEKLQAHHTNYDKPLEVTWLCPPCHGKTWRKQNGS